MQTTYKKGDTIIIALLLCAALMLFSLPLWRSATAAAYLTVSYADGSEQVFFLDRDQTLTLTGNGHTLTVVIENAGVRVTAGTCPDGLCRTHAITRHGEMLVCVPAGIALTITGEGGDVDAIIG